MRIVNQELVNYIKQYSSTYPVDQLKQTLIQQGHSSQEVEEAAHVAAGGAPAGGAPPAAQPAAQQMPQGKQALNNVLKFGVLGGAAGGIVKMVASFIGDFFANGGGFVSYFLDIALGVAFGVGIAYVLFNYSSKLPLKGSLLMKAFMFAIVLDLIVLVIMGGLGNSVGFFIGVVGIIGGDFLYAKLFADNMKKTFGIV